MVGTLRKIWYRQANIKVESVIDGGVFDADYDLNGDGRLDRFDIPGSTEYTNVVSALVTRLNNMPDPATVYILYTLPIKVPPSVVDDTDGFAPTPATPGPLGFAAIIGQNAGDQGQSVLLSVIAHEIGHALSAKHVEVAGTPEVMQKSHVIGTPPGCAVRSQTWRQVSPSTAPTP